MGLGPELSNLHELYSKLSRGVIYGNIRGTTIGVIEGDIRSSDYSSYK